MAQILIIIMILSTQSQKDMRYHHTFSPALQKFLPSIAAHNKLLTSSHVLGNETEIMNIG